MYTYNVRRFPASHPPNNLSDFLQDTESSHPDPCPKNDYRGLFIWFLSVIVAD